mgnify:CR=1 FL=1
MSEKLHGKTTGLASPDLRALENCWGGAPSASAP